MASFGTIYSWPNDPRVKRAQVIAALNGLELKVPGDFKLGTDNKTPGFLAKFPLGKVPAFEGSDGFTLAEGSAISTYLAASGPLATQLLGADLKSSAKIAEWTLFADTELLAHYTPALVYWVKLAPFDEGRFGQEAAAFERAVGKVEAAVKGGKKYLVGEELTLADLEVASLLFFAGGFLWDAEARKAAPATVEYVKGIAATPEFAKVFGEFKPVETRVRGGA
ncbi:hypothetical protein VPNG_07607 [Cytospora leucostoma]|uniref:Glutathione S-transferase n=1 Tax=Cytospora leucostoma TaxID=1230097 RepID=A0A423WDY8_9PEZI|nr:hypothetical protein VPNG_07607 [Cytospora leucostoma]